MDRKAARNCRESPFVAYDLPGCPWRTPHESYEDLVLAGAFHFKLFDPERATRLAQHGGADSNYG
jgi:hypothetical protein